MRKRANIKELLSKAVAKYKLVADKHGWIRPALYAGITGAAGYGLLSLSDKLKWYHKLGIISPLMALAVGKGIKDNPAPKVDINKLTSVISKGTKDYQGGDYSDQKYPPTMWDLAADQLAEHELSSPHLGLPYFHMFWNEALKQKRLRLMPWSTVMTLNTKYDKDTAHWMASSLRKTQSDIRGVNRFLRFGPGYIGDKTPSLREKLRFLLGAYGSALDWKKYHDFMEGY